MSENAVEAPEPEEAQRVFADLYDGDYLMSDLMARSPEMMRAVMTLFYEVWERPVTPEPSRSTIFRGASGEATEISRPTRKSLGIDSVKVDKVTVRVRNGRVEGFSKA